MVCLEKRCLSWSIVQSLNPPRSKPSFSAVLFILPTEFCSTYTIYRFDRRFHGFLYHVTCNIGESLFTILPHLNKRYSV